MTNQLIRRFRLEGTTADSNLELHKRTWEKTVVQMMKDEGFVPLLDIDPHFSWNWVKEDEFTFVFTWHGVYVGEEKAWQTEGILGGRTIPFTRKIK